MEENQEVKDTRKESSQESKAIFQGKDAKKPEFGSWHWELRGKGKCENSLKDTIEKIQHFISCVRLKNNLRQCPILSQTEQLVVLIIKRGDMGEGKG